ncbi:MAG TPA: hypothetical protein VHW96_01965 [Solirubrobacteraceae bacterium]|nr:hypothetical protein [Solirubrobacteraceae bacterium]
MKYKQFSALAGGVAALVLAVTAPALGAGSGAGVTVRVEGLKRTLLPATVAHTESGSITKGGTPKGSCPGSSGAGYFDSATHHKWTGTYSSGLGVEITSVLGEAHKFSAKGFYWGIWVNDTFASAGLCDLKLKPGDELLLAPAPGSGTAYPIVLTAPAKATVGHAFSVRTSYFKTSKGKAKSLPGVKVTDAGALTDHNGHTTVTVTKPGTVTLVATLKGDIRAEATVNVTK